MTVADESDETLMMRYGRGDAAAFDLLYRRHEMRVWRYLKRNVGNRATADELMQEVWFAVARDALRYEPSARFTTWLFTIAHNTLVTSLRRGQVEVRARRRVGIREALEFAPDELERVEAVASRDDWVLELMKRLPAEQREAVRSRIVDERSYTEIATELRTSELVIRKRVSRGLATLRNQLKEPS